MDNIINEVARIKPKQLTSKGNRIYWALYAGFYEKLFQKIDNITDLKDAYNIRVKNSEFTGEAKDALTFFYRIRRDELDDPNFWDKVKENKEETMKLIPESLNEYFSREIEEGSEEDLAALDSAKKEAWQISKDEGVAQHVNQIRPGLYKVEDWFDSDTTVASFEGGREL